MGNSEILNLLGGDQLQLDLEANESVYIKADAQLLIDNSLEINSAVGGSSGEGSIGGLFRSFSDEDVFFKKISNRTNNIATMMISPIFPGYIQEIEIATGDNMVFSSHSILACTTNLNISNKTGELANLMGSAGLAFTEISCPDGVEGGMVWVYSWSGAYSKNLEDPHNFKVYAGLLVGCPSKVFDQIVSIGESGLGKTLSGKGLMLNFEKCVSEGEVYLQLANIPEIMFKISSQRYEPRMEYSFLMPVAGAVAGAAAVAGAEGAAQELAEEGTAEPESSVEEEGTAKEGEEESEDEEEGTAEEGEESSPSPEQDSTILESTPSTESSTEETTDSSMESGSELSSSPISTEETTERKTPSEWLSTSAESSSSPVSPDSSMIQDKVPMANNKQNGRGISTRKNGGSFRRTIKHKK